MPKRERKERKKTFYSYVFQKTQLEIKFYKLMSVNVKGC